MSRVTKNKKKEKKRRPRNGALAPTRTPKKHCVSPYATGRRPETHMAGWGALVNVRTAARTGRHERSRKAAVLLMRARERCPCEAQSMGSTLLSAQTHSTRSARTSPAELRRVAVASLERRPAARAPARRGSLVSHGGAVHDCLVLLPTAGGPDPANQLGYRMLGIAAPHPCLGRHRCWRGWRAAGPVVRTRP